MNKYLIIWSFLFVLPITLLAQNDVDSVLSQVEKNNTTLSALRKSVEAEKIGNKTGIYLQNPEVGFNYLWSDPKSVGNRTDINVKQSFDFPTAYGYRRQISEFRNTQAELDYQKQRKNILLDARLLCAEIIYTNTLLEEYMVRLTYAQQLADAYQEMYNNGEVGILENNKAQLNLLNIKKEVDAVKVEQSTYLKQLSALNGGKPIVLNSNTLSLPPIPSDFDQWYSQSEQANPALLWLNQEVQLSQQQTKLNRALTLPKASAGYMSENRVGEHFQGITAGVSIPLWENKNTVRFTQVRTLAMQSMVTDYKLQFYNQLKIQFEKAVSLQNTVTEYRQSLKLYENTGLLKIALDKGEISLLNYLMELSLAYSTIDKFMKAENELNKAVVLLYQYRD
jgi:cobalt-zinc-cadmium efflux system outer membrane protein